MLYNLKKPLLRDEQLYFIHVPKCAGTSFISLVDERYVIDEIIPTHFDIKKLKNEITDQQLNGYRFIRGHFPYDLIVPRLKTKPRIITFLRNPVTRFISNFQMRQRVPGPVGGYRGVFEGLTLEEFLERPDLVRFYSNYATRLIGGLVKNKVGEMAPNLDLAKKRLAEMDFVGIVEQYNDSLGLFCYLFDLPDIQNERTLNVSPDRGKRSEIGEELLKRVAEIVRADIELYEYGRELFRNQFSRMIQEKKDNVRYPSPPKCIRVRDDLSRVDPGMGWHVAERLPGRGVIRWSGSEKTARLRYPLRADGNYTLKFTVIDAAALDILESLKVYVNGVNIPLEHRKIKKISEVTFKAPILRDILRPEADFTHITFEVNRTVSPRENNPDNPDERVLGLCYHELSVEPK